jgi:hypothetical protein
MKLGDSLVTKTHYSCYSISRYQYTYQEGIDLKGLIVHTKFI